nr:transposase [Micrococcus luteus]
MQTLPGDAGSLEGDAGKVGGFSLHAGVAAEAHESHKLEKLCRYITRPAISEQRLSISPQGRVRYQLKTPWRNGTTHVEWDAVDFIAKLAALVPPPRAHLTRFHGVFAPNANLRAQVTPSGAASGLRAMRRQWTQAPRRAAQPRAEAPCDELGATAQAGLFHRHHHLPPTAAARYGSSPASRTLKRPGFRFRGQDATGAES